MNDELSALRSSTLRLARVASGLDVDALAASAYPSEWNVGDVFSHLGSAAVIMTHLFLDVVHEREAVSDLHTGVWAEWNAKAPTAQVAESLEASEALVDHLESFDEARRGDFRLSLGPLSVDFPGFVALRLNEQAVHTWDIEVAFDPAAVIPAEIAGPVSRRLQLTTRFGAKTDGVARHVRVRTTDPEGRFVLEVGEEGCDLVEGVEGPADLTLPAESFARLVYGRLDPAHTPAGVQGAELDALRLVFPGI